MNRNVKVWAVGVVLAVLLVGGTYAVTSLLVSGQMMQAPQAKPDVWERIAVALERIATAMEKSAGNSGMMGGMGMMGQGMMNPQMAHQMGDMMSMMGHMMGMMGNMMAGPGMMGQDMSSMMQACQQMMGAVPPTQAPAGQLTEADLTRTTSGAGITVAATFMNPLMKPEETAGKLVFKIALDTHAGDLMQYDLTKLAVLRTSKGAVVDKGFIWEPQSESSHHRLGLLKVDATVEGKPLITKDTKYIELELKEIGVPSRLFKWEGEYLGSEAQE